MTYSVLTKVTNRMYKGQKFHLYKHSAESLTTFSKTEAGALEFILNLYPDVFSETKLIPMDEDSIKFLESFKGNDKRPLIFQFENVTKDCSGILEQLEIAFDFPISGIDRKETFEQTFKN